MLQVTEVTKLRRRVLSEIAKLSFAGKLADNVGEILNTVVTEQGPRYRCCVHKERAVLKDRINMALSQPMNTSLEKAAKNALDGQIADDLPIINVMPEACDQCPIDKFMVTDACRNCIAHYCMASCPKKAINIYQDRAYIDKNKCIECGLCKKSCPYGAIIEISRPCERACDLNAITAGQDRKAVIDYDVCVQCGACKTACPFGAISERSYIVQVIEKLKADDMVYAMVAPAFVGQFGPTIKPGQLWSALETIGFAGVFEVALGADIVSLLEAQEFIEAVPAKSPFLTTSCCPAFVSMIEQHFPEFEQNISSTVSPMVATAKYIKSLYPDSTVIFIGPCSAKKAEAKKYEVVDYVITYEELAAIFEGAGVDIKEQPEVQYERSASEMASRFAHSGGVLAAVQDVLQKTDCELELIPGKCEGLTNCKQILQQIKDGKLNTNFIEGMACTGGCVGGPGTLVDSRITTKLVDNYAMQSDKKGAKDNHNLIKDTGSSKLHRAK